MGELDRDRIQQTVRIPVEYGEVEVDTTRQGVSKLMNRLIMDDDFRVEFNKHPAKLLREVGITLDERMIEHLEASPITEMVKETIPGTEVGGAVLVIIGVIIGVIAPPKPAE